MTPNARGFLHIENIHFISTRPRLSKFSFISEMMLHFMANALSMDEVLCTSITRGQERTFPLSIQSKNGFKPLFCAHVIRFLLSLLCFSTKGHRHFLLSWLIPDGSCSSGRAFWPSVAHQSWFFFFFFFNAAFHFILTRGRGEVFPGNLREAVTLLAPMWLMNIICRNLCGAGLVTLRAGEAIATNYPAPPSQGQGWGVCQGSWSLDLLCIAFPLSGRILVSPNAYTHIYHNKRGKSSRPFFPALFLDATAPRSQRFDSFFFNHNI